MGPHTLGGSPILPATAGRLGDDLIHGGNRTGGRFASILAFTSATPGVTGGMLRRQCTAEYKIHVVERIIRRLAEKCEPPTLAETHGLVVTDGADSETFG